MELKICPVCGEEITWEDRGYARMPICACPDDDCYICGLPEGQCGCDDQPSCEEEQINPPLLEGER